jgi:uncharacterized protein
MNLSILPGPFAICRLAPDAAVPAWAWDKTALLSITYTADELSLVCPASRVPLDVQAERNWSAIKVAGPLDFSLTGILSALAEPLATAGIPIFAISTFETDYLLVKEQHLPQARLSLERNGHTFM